MTGAASEIRQATIRAQLAREFADRLEIEAEAWLQVSTAKRQKAIEYRMQAHKLTVKADALRKAAKGKGSSI